MFWPGFQPRAEVLDMNHVLMFSRASDQWQTPPDVFGPLDVEFRFDLDVAALRANAQCDRYLGPDQARPDWRDGLLVSWARVASSCWMNPPYSQCRRFIAKAALEAQRGCTVVALVPSRTCTRWWHQHIWFGSGPRPGVEVRFLKGRVKFLPSANSAPFPSVVIVFRPSVATSPGGPDD
jgi:phage N-6-adenine-methyltransferase